MKTRIFLPVIMALILVPVIATFAQTTSVLTAGLERPSKVITAADNSLLVSESGTSAPNTGRISVINRATGVRQTLINGLPSGVSNLGGPPEPSGVSGLALRGNTLYLTIGSGNATMNVGGPGLEAPNPNPSSPLFDSVLELTLPGGYAGSANNFSMTMADQTALVSGATVALTNFQGQRMLVRMVVNLPDNVPNPRPGFPNNVRASNLFGVETFQRDLYVVDASRNLIHRVDSVTGQSDIFTTFPNKQNPLFPNLGGPTVEPVPDNIHRFGNRLLVPLLTGFPFAAGLAEVQSINLTNGEHETLIPGLTSAIDVLHLEGTAYLTLEFSANQLANQPGRLRFYSASNAVPVVIAANLISPTSMARDEITGDIFVAEIFTGRIIRVQVL
jgi:hypothetical protein